MCDVFIVLDVWKREDEKDDEGEKVTLRTRAKLSPDVLICREPFNKFSLSRKIMF